MISFNEEGNKTVEYDVVLFMLIEKYFDPNIESKRIYVNRNVRAKLKEKDELSYELFFKVVDVAGKFSN